MPLEHNLLFFLKALELFEINKCFLGNKFLNVFVCEGFLQTLWTILNYHNYLKLNQKSTPLISSYGSHFILKFSIKIPIPTIILGGFIYANKHFKHQYFMSYLSPTLLESEFIYIRPPIAPPPNANEMVKLVPILSLSIYALVHLCFIGHMWFCFYIILTYVPSREYHQIYYRSYLCLMNYAILTVNTIA